MVFMVFAFWSSLPTGKGELWGNFGYTSVHPRGLTWSYMDLARSATGKDLQSRQRDHCVWIWIGLSLMSGIRATSPNSSALPVVSIVVQHGICSTAADSLVSNNCHTTDVVSVHVRRRSTRRWRPLLWTHWAGAGSAEPTAEHRAGNAQVKLSAAPRRRRTESCH